MLHAYTARMRALVSSCLSKSKCQFFSFFSLGAPNLLGIGFSRDEAISLLFV